MQYVRWGTRSAGKTSADACPPFEFAMAIKTIHCHVAQAAVPVVVDLAGDIVQVICPEFESGTGRCRLKLQGSTGGPLSRLLERVAEESLESHGARCDFGSHAVVGHAG